MKGQPSSITVRNATFDITPTTSFSHNTKGNDSGVFGTAASHSSCIRSSYKDQWELCWKEQADSTHQTTKWNLYLDDLLARLRCCFSSVLCSATGALCTGHITVPVAECVLPRGSVRRAKGQLRSPHTIATLKDKCLVTTHPSVLLVSKLLESSPLKVLTCLLIVM